MDEAIKHLKKDKFFKQIVKDFDRPKFTEGRDYFGSLVRAIIYQQISGLVAASIEKKFLALFKKSKLKPADLLKLKEAQFKSAGVSPQKQKYLIDLSEKFLDGTISPKKFPKMSDAEIREHLIMVKGVGVWTADMFLIYTLNRMDVLPTKDLGIQKGFQVVFNLKKLPSHEKMEKLAKGWSPYRTVASMYLWRVADQKKVKQK